MPLPHQLVITSSQWSTLLWLTIEQTTHKHTHHSLKLVVTSQVLPKASIRQSQEWKTYNKTSTDIYEDAFHTITQAGYSKPTNFITTLFSTSPTTNQHPKAAQHCNCTIPSKNTITTNWERLIHPQTTSSVQSISSKHHNIQQVSHFFLCKFANMILSRWGINPHLEKVRIADNL